MSALSWVIALFPLYLLINGKLGNYANFAKGGATGPVNPNDETGGGGGR